MDIKEITDIVFDINNEIYDVIGETYSEYYLFNLTAQTDGYLTIVKYLGFCIWNDDDDEREEITEDVYEPLEVFLKRKMKEIHAAHNVMINNLN